MVERVEPHTGAVLRGCHVEWVEGVEGEGVSVGLVERSVVMEAEKVRPMQSMMYIWSAQSVAVMAGRLCGSPATLDQEEPLNTSTDSSSSPPATTTVRPSLTTA